MREYLQLRLSKTLLIFLFINALPPSAAQTTPEAPECHSFRGHSPPETPPACPNKGAQLVYRPFAAVVTCSDVKERNRKTTHTNSHLSVNKYKQTPVLAETWAINEEPENTGGGGGVGRGGGGTRLWDFL